VTPAIQLFWARHTRIARPDERAFQTFPIDALWLRAASIANG